MAVNADQIVERRIPDGDEPYGVTVKNDRGFYLGLGVPVLVAGVAATVAGVLMRGGQQKCKEGDERYDESECNTHTIPFIVGGLVAAAGGTTLTIMGGVAPPSLRRFPSGGYPNTVGESDSAGTLEDVTPGLTLSGRF